MSRPRSSTLIRVLVLVSSLGLVLGSSSPAAAQGVQTGEIGGGVTSSDGQPLPGVTVTITSTALQGARTAVTSPNGDYLFKHLPLGAYKVAFEISGFARVERNESIALGASVRANASMSVASMEEKVTVVAESPSVIRDPQAGANIKAEEYDHLARNRDLEAVAELAPGLSQTAVNNDLAISGAFSYDNAYLLDGVDINDSSYSAPNNVYIEDAIEETQVLTSGITAEYGRFTGGAVNAVTKRGGNQFSGSFRVDFTNPSWTEETPFEKSQEITLEDTTQKRYQATLGGPVVKDRLWFFLAGRLNNLDDPKVFDETGIAYTESSKDKRFQARLTGAITPNHTLNATYTKNDTTEDGGVNSCCTFIDPASINPQRFPLSLLGIGYNGVLRSNLFAEAQFSQQKTKIEFGGTSTDIVDSPFIAATLPGTYGAPYFDATDPAVRDNRQLTAALSYFLSTSKLGRHDIKGGFENFRTTDVGGNSQSSTSYVFYTDYLLDVEGHPVVVDGSAQPVFTPFATFILNWRPTRGAKIDITTNSFYLNDRWALNNKLSFNLGLRYERVRSEATGDIVSVDTDTIVPRLAATFDVKGDGRYTLQATYGHYAGRYGTSQFAGNTNVGNPSLVYGLYLGPEGTGKDFAPGFDPANYVTVGGFFPTANVFFAPGLSSPVNREFTLSGGVGLGAGSYAKLIYVHRKLTGFVEDFQTFEGGSTTVEEDGEVFGTFTNQYFENSDLPRRNYEALRPPDRLPAHEPLAGGGTLDVHAEERRQLRGRERGHPGHQLGHRRLPRGLRSRAQFPRRAPERLPASQGAGVDNLRSRPRQDWPRQPGSPLALRFGRGLQPGHRQSAALGHPARSGSGLRQPASDPDPLLRGAGHGALRVREPFRPGAQLRDTRPQDPATLDEDRGPEHVRGPVAHRLQHHGQRRSRQPVGCGRPAHRLHSRIPVRPGHEQDPLSRAANRSVLAGVPLLEAGQQVEVGHPRGVAKGQRPAVAAERDAARPGQARHVGGTQGLPGLAMARREVDAQKLQGHPGLPRANEEGAAVRGPGHRHESLHAGDGSGLAAVERVEAEGERPARSDDGLAVGRHEIAGDDQPLGRDGAGSAALGIADEDTQVAAPLPAHEDHPRAIRRVACPFVLHDAVVAKRARLARAGGQDRDVVGRAQGHGQGEATVGREGGAHPAAQAHRRRPVGATQVGRVGGAPGVAGFIEESQAAVGGKGDHAGRVEPGQVALDPGGIREAHSHAVGGALQKDPPVSGHVVEDEPARGGKQDPLTAVQIEGEQGSAAAHARGGEPHLVALRRPGEAFEAREVRGLRDWLPRTVEYHHQPSVVARSRVLEKRDLGPVGRDAQVGRRVHGREHVADRELDLNALAHHAMGHGELRAVGPDVRFEHRLEDRLQGPTGEGSAREEREPAGLPEEKHHIPALGDAGQAGARGGAEGASVGRARTGRVERGWFPVPGRR